MDKKHFSKKQICDLIFSDLKNERSSFEGQWRDCADFILPTRPRFFITDANNGSRKNLKIYNSTATLANRTLSAGLMAGVTSQARQWFRLTTQDKQLAEYGPVKEWLHVVTERLLSIFIQSNFYNKTQQAYGDLGAFGTAPISVEEDLQLGGIFCQSFPIGSYYLGQTRKGVVDVFGRQFRMTVKQVVDMFGRNDEITGKPDWSNISLHVKNLYEKSNYSTWININHLVRPNPDHDPNKAESKYKSYVSDWYETGYDTKTNRSNYMASSGDADKFLKQSGYDMFPVLVPRWGLTGEDIYATSWPGSVALGDIKQLQHSEMKSAKATDKMVDPPMVGHTDLKKNRASIIPGDITYMDDPKMFVPAHDVSSYRINEHLNKQQAIEHRIQRAFYEDLFLMLANDRRNMRATAREIDERHEEKLIALGPVLEQLNVDFLDPLIDLVFDIALRQEQIPPPPEELQGQPLKVEYVSIMAQAQKAAGLGAIDRFMTYVGELAAASQDPTVWQKVNLPQSLDIYAERVGVDPSIIRPDDEFEKILESQQQAAAQQQKAAAAQDMIGAAKTLSDTKLEGNSALDAMLAQSQAGQIVEGV